MPNLRGPGEDRPGRLQLASRACHVLLPPLSEAEAGAEAVPPDVLSFSPAFPSSHTFSA